MPDKNENNQGIILECLYQVIYWRDRFEVSRDLSFLDNAERHEEVIRDYLPTRFKDVNIIKLCLVAQSMLNNEGIDGYLS